MLNERQLFQQHLAPTSPSPLLLEIERAEGSWLYEKSGKKYLDLISGISVNHIGHCNPKVVEAIKNQSEKYLHTMVYGEYVQTPQVMFAEKLCSVLPSKLNSVYFTNSGAEATEGAMKLAKRLTGRTEIISFKNCYHGSTQGALSLIGNENLKTNFRPLLPETKQILYNDISSLKEITSKTAAVFFEPIQAESGITIPDFDYVKKLRARCDETKTLLVFDECQTAFGKTGKLFAFEKFEVVPDILLLAKALGGGMPLGAFISSYDNMKILSVNPALGHITTFGGHPVCCAAGLAALEFLLDEKIVDDVLQKEKLFLENIQHKKISSCGLMIALEFDSFEANKKIIDQCIELGVITDWFLFAPHCLRIAPPLTISTEEIMFACNIINQATN